MPRRENYDARLRWPRLVGALARYLAGPEPTDDDLADATDAIGDYLVWRATAPDDPTTAALGRSVSNAIINRSER